MPDDNQNPFLQDENKEKPKATNGFNKPKKHVEERFHKDINAQASNMKRQDFKRNIEAKPINPFAAHSKPQAKVEPKPEPTKPKVEAKPEVKVEPKPEPTKPKVESKPESVKPINPFAAHSKPQAKVELKP